MKCQNHPEVEATTRCAGCAEAFCSNCTIELGGQAYCGACKHLALGGRQPRVLSATEVYGEAGGALKMAFVGFFLFGFILGPMAIGKALGARTVIRNNPTLLGWGKATAGLWLGVIVLTMSILGFITRLKS